MKLDPIPGTSDLTAADIADWYILEMAASDIFPRYGCDEIRTPILERTDLFMHNIGEGTDIVQKEMYTFTDRGGRSLTLRPEGTAGVIRAIANEGIDQGDERRVYYLGPMFRGERPAAGRRRQFNQVGVEIVGRTAPEIDAECIAMMVHYLDALDIANVRLLINSRGEEADHKRICTTLKSYFAGHLKVLCEDCRKRHETNVLRIMDCKIESCQAVIAGAPPIPEMLSPENQDYFRDVLRNLDAVHVKYQLEPRLVRGLDYYAQTVFEAVFDGIGAQNALCGGGRYNIRFGGSGKPVDGVGFAAGMERLLLAREELGIERTGATSVDLYLVCLGADALSRALGLASELRQGGYSVLADYTGRAMRGQMRSANKSGAGHVLILGDDEIERGVIICKNMETSEQVELSLGDVVGAMAAHFGIDDEVDGAHE